MHLLTIPVLVIALGQDAKEAELAFRTAEEKLAKADSMQITFNGTFNGAKLKGMMLMAKENKSRTELTGEFDEGKSLKWTAISDGKKMRIDATTPVGESKRSDQDTPVNAQAMMARVTCRAGFAMGHLLVSFSNKRLEEADSRFTVSEFSLGKKEKIGDRAAQRIDCKLNTDPKDETKTVDVQVWLDSETNLPLKLILNGKRPQKFEIIETYDTRINVNIEPKMFELPK